jgi:hypothetical protein
LYKHSHEKRFHISIDVVQLTPPMSNDDENQRPNTVVSFQKEKKPSSSISRPTQRGTLSRSQPDQSTPTIKKNELNNPVKLQRNRRKYFSFLLFTSKNHQSFHRSY